MVLFVGRTFLPDLSEAEGRDDGTACCLAKIRQFFLILPQSEQEENLTSELLNILI